VSREALEAGLAALGRRVQDIQRVIVTHHHADHMGLAAEIVQRSGAGVWTHPYNVPWLSDLEGQQQRQQPFYAAIWQEAGVPTEIVTQMDSANLGIRRWADPVAATQTLEEGETVPLGDGIWQVLHTPGHAGGLICLWDPASRTLLANDHVLRDISPNPVLEPAADPTGPRPRRLVEYLHHLQRVAALEPLLTLTGHGEAVTDIASLVRQRLAFHERRANRLLDSLNGSAVSLWDLTRQTFPRVQRGMDHFLALSEVLAHLDLLESDGRVQAQTHAGRVFWLRR
jgi:glyoxylase-like metal-dependent hydrolase (beta-lactamase superfamily II)